MHTTPTGRFARRAWHLRERLIGVAFDLPDLRNGAYVQLADPSLEFTASPASVPRQRILDNLLGDAGFCPTVRRTESSNASSTTSIAAASRCSSGSPPSCCGEPPATSS